MTKRLLGVLIVVTTTTLSSVFFATQANAMAFLTLALGFSWLILEINDKHAFSWLFFLTFLSLAGLGGLQNLSVPMLLLGLSTNLAAWDLSRFYARTSSEPQSELKSLLERNHAQKLFATLGMTFLVALVPVFIRISIGFVGLVLVVVVAMLALRRSILSLLSVNR